MQTCSHCGLPLDRVYNGQQFVEVDCGFCNWSEPVEKSQDTRWAGYGDTSPDGRMIETDPRYAILERAKKACGL